jgi:hypothetical protein
MAEDEVSVARLCKHLRLAAAAPRAKRKAVGTGAEERK